MKHICKLLILLAYGTVQSDDRVLLDVKRVDNGDVHVQFSVFADYTSIEYKPRDGILAYSVVDGAEVIWSAADGGHLGGHVPAKGTVVGNDPGEGPSSHPEGAHHLTRQAPSHPISSDVLSITSESEATVPGATPESANDIDHSTGEIDTSASETDNLDIGRSTERKEGCVSVSVYKREDSVMLLYMLVQRADSSLFGYYYEWDTALGRWKRINLFSYIGKLRRLMSTRTLDIDNPVELVKKNVISTQFGNSIAFYRMISKYVIYKVVDGNLVIWEQGDPKEVCLKVNVVYRDGKKVLIRIETFSPSELNDLYYHFVDGQWLQLCCEREYKLLFNKVMSECKLNISEDNPNVDEDGQNEDIDESKPPLFRKYYLKDLPAVTITPEYQVHLTQIWDEDQLIWRGEKLEDHCIDCVLYHKDGFNVIFKVYTSDGSNCEYKYYRNDGQLWTSIDENEFYEILEPLKKGEGTITEWSEGD